MANGVIFYPFFLKLASFKAALCSVFKVECVASSVAKSQIRKKIHNPLGHCEMVIRRNALIEFGHNQQCEHLYIYVIQVGSNKNF